MKFNLIIDPHKEDAVTATVHCRSLNKQITG